MAKRSLTPVLLSLTMAALISAVPMDARQSDQSKGSDNTAVNKRDTKTPEPTADQGKNNLSDRQLMAHIRRDVVKDKALSTYAHNVKIIAQNGKVTLKGPVHSDEEKRAIEEHARKYAGDGNVTNELEVKSEQK